MMSGGLVVLGFLFLIFIFRSAIVGDLAPTAHQRGPPPRAKMPPATPPLVKQAGSGEAAFSGARQLGRKAEPNLDTALNAMPLLGFGDPRILDATPEWMRVRVYANGQPACDAARGYLVGVLERAIGGPVKADEVECRHANTGHCDFVIRHPLRKVMH